MLTLVPIDAFSSTFLIYVSPKHNVNVLTTGMTNLVPLSNAILLFCL